MTKKNSAYIVQPAGSKSRKEQFSRDPMNLTGLHNASSQGFTAEEAVGLAAERGESEKKKDFRKVFILMQAKDGGKLCCSTKKIAKGAPKTAKTIKELTYINDKKRTLLYKRLGKLNNGLNKKQ